MLQDTVDVDGCRLKVCRCQYCGYFADTGNALGIQRVLSKKEKVDKSDR